MQSFLWRLPTRLTRCSRGITRISASTSTIASSTSASSSSSTSSSNRNGFGVGWKQPLSTATETAGGEASAGASAGAGAGGKNAQPAAFQAQFLQTMLERGYIHQCTDYVGLDRLIPVSPVSAYLGFDVTASSLHVGSLLQIMILRALQKSGHKPVVLLGGGTSKVGDPSGKDSARQLLTPEQITANASSLAKVFAKFLTFGDGPTDAVIVDNSSWLDELNYLDFLRDYGRHFTVNRLLTFDSVKTRLSREQPLSFLEFNYIMLQSYDYLQLWRTRSVSLQIGGSDQWGNIVSGVELGRKVEQARLYGLTTPLITTAAGGKMGKTEGGAVWLNAEQLSAYDYWQFWRNTADADVDRFLKLFTELSLDEIASMSQWQGAQLNAAKVVLADEATQMLHGAQCLPDIHATVEALFAAHSSTGGADLASLPARAAGQGLPVVELLVLAGMASSNSEARRLVRAGGARVNDVKVGDEHAVVTASDFHLGGDSGEPQQLKLSSGKKKHKVVVLAA
eukprot:GSChrysophyteH2.ASY1.ANO1.61.1 assembled CDS